MVFLWFCCSVSFFKIISNNRAIKVISQTPPRLLVCKLCIVESLPIPISRFIWVLYVFQSFHKAAEFQDFFIYAHLENITYIYIKRFTEESICSASAHANFFSKSIHVNKQDGMFFTLLLGRNFINLKYFCTMPYRNTIISEEKGIFLFSNLQFQ